MNLELKISGLIIIFVLLTSLMLSSVCMKLVSVVEELGMFRSMYEVVGSGGEKHISALLMSHHEYCPVSNLSLVRMGGTVSSLSF